MPGVPSGNFVKVTFQFTLYAVQSASVSFWLKFPSPAVSGGMAALATGSGDSNYTTNLRSWLLGQMNTGQKLVGITYRAYQPDSQTLFDQATKTYSDAGTLSTWMPPQVAMVASLRTAGFGRAYRGRVYFPTAVQGNATTGRASAAQTAAAATAVRAYLAQWVAGSVTPVLISLSRGVATPLTYVEVDAVMDTQRRRRDKMIDPAPSVSTI